MKNIREAFEKITLPSFSIEDRCMINEKGEYKPIIEDHRQTFQEGWEAAIDYLKSKKNSCYTDIISNGGMDTR